MTAPTQTPVTAKEMIFELWRKTLAEIDAHQVDEQSAKMFIAETRQALRDCGLTPVEEHDLLCSLRNALPMLTDGHPITKQFNTLLFLQLECN